ncbi:MAG: 16S rRNA processing protein RimM [Candidatus Rokubacteria bacterium]|nr:16S rRNA processing protein RimM [Candidatus Rokubacteria bacterium]
MAERLVVIGEVSRVHGLRGEVQVRPMTDRPERFEGLSGCVLWDASRDERETRRISTARVHGAVVVLRFEGDDSPEAAQRRIGRLLAVPESEALPLPEGSFYPWQLEGARVMTEDGREVGRIVRIESGAQELWVIADGGREHLIPAVPEIVIEVDLAAGRVVIRPPDGLLDL